MKKGVRMKVKEEGVGDAGLMKVRKWLGKK